MDQEGYESDNEGRRFTYIYEEEEMESPIIV